MGKREYGADFLYEQCGRMAMENAMLKEELAYAQTAVKELEKDLDMKSAEIKDLLKQEEELKETIKGRDATIVFLEEQLAEKDQMIAGFNHEHAGERAEEERDDF